MTVDMIDKQELLKYLNESNVYARATYTLYLTEAAYIKELIVRDIEEEQEDMNNG